MFARVIVSILLFFAASHVALAHDAWIEKQNGEFVVLYGHGNNHEGYDPSEVKECKGLDAQGESVPVDIVRGQDKASMVPKGNPAVLIMFYDTGYKVRTADGWKKGTKRQMTDKGQILNAMKIERFCKTFLAPSDVWSKPLGQHLEILPLANPMTVKPGDQLPIRVLLEGKPLEGAHITGSDKHADPKAGLKTDKDGLAKVPVQPSGLQMIRAGHMIPLKDDPDADTRYLSALMTFPVSPH